MPEAKPAGKEDDAGEDAGDQLSGDALDLDGLKARGDVAGLLTLAKAYRSGSAPSGRDMKRCFDAYRAAAELGSADAEYAVALFCMSGGIVPQDLKEGATRLRAAAEKGSVPAKVYLGNLYELGIHYKADPEKADVWYRNAARGAHVESEPGSEDYATELAELGCARYVLARVESGAVDGDDKARLLQRARAHGYGLRLKDEGAMDRPTFLGALQDSAGDGAIATAATGPDGQRPERQRAVTTPDTKSARAVADARDADKKPVSKPSGPTRSSIGLEAFGYAILFMLAGLGSAYAAMLGARELVTHGTLLPALGARTHLVFPIVLGIIGVLPMLLVYRFGTFLKAVVMGAAFGGIGWVAWGTGQAALLTMRPTQALAFALAGFLAALLVLGLLGGTKKQPTTPRSRRPPMG